MARTTVAERPRADETASGLPAWEVLELPEPLRPKGLQWFGVVGPGVIALGGAIGSGEFLLGPAAFIQYALVVLWITGVATILQTVAALAGLRTAFVGEARRLPGHLSGSRRSWRPTFLRRPRGSWRWSATPD